MTCYAPLRGFYSAEVNPETGKRPLVFDVRKAHSDIPVRVPCGECVGCRLDQSRGWAIRCLHEMKMHHASAFLTLTYSQGSLPAGSTLVKRDLQLFMKRLRKRRARGLRFFACGEYGELTQRPHYHVLLLSTNFPDQRRFKTSQTGEDLYVSAELESLWTMGAAEIGNVSMRSCAYVTGYVVKKQIRTFDYGDREPEFRCMSLRPGLGWTWFQRFNGEAYAHDSVVVDGRETKIPRYYDTKFEGVDAARLVEVKRLRRLKAQEQREENTPERRRVRERVVQLNSERFKREVDLDGGA